MFETVCKNSGGGWGCRSNAYTVAPACARASPWVRPSPRPPPVMRITFEAMERSGREGVAVGVVA